MGQFKVGKKVMVKSGYWKGFEGKIIHIYNEEDYPIQIEFDEGDTNSYYDYQLELL